MTDDIIRQIEKHGIEVRLREATSVDQDLGRISGRTIEVVEDPVEPTVAPFTLCHLFGHMVQFTNIDRYRHLIEPVATTPPVRLSGEFWQEFYAYEQEAFGYGASLLDRSVQTDDALLSRYANFLEVDFDHFRSYVATNCRLNRIQYREKLLRRYEDYPTASPIKPLSFSAVKWSNFPQIEAKIY